MNTMKPAGGSPADNGEGKKASTAAITTATTNSSSSSSPLPKLPNVVLNPLAQPSPYATSQLVRI